MKEKFSKNKRTIFKIIVLLMSFLNMSVAIAQFKNSSNIYLDYKFDSADSNSVEGVSKTNYKKIERSIAKTQQSFVFFLLRDKSNFYQIERIFQSKNSKSLKNITLDILAIKLSSSGELFGTFAVFLNSFKPTIYLNKNWKEFLSVDQISKLILEETVHYLNTKINYLSDTRGVEGEIHTSLVWIIASDMHKIDRLSLGNDKVNLIFEQKS